jgi:membrane protease subunit (stomatin/prohibitin family)
MEGNMSIFDKLNKVNRAVNTVGNTTRTINQTTRSVNNLSHNSQVRKQQKQRAANEKAAVKALEWKCVCGKTAKTKFCDSCGKAKPACPGCGADSTGAKFCGECGTPMEG